MFNWFKNKEDEMTKYYSGSSTYWKYEEEKEQEERRQRRIHILVGCVTAAFIAFAGFVIFGATFQEESRVEVLTPEDNNEVHVNENRLSYEADEIESTDTTGLASDYNDGSISEPPITPEPPTPKPEYDDAHTDYHDSSMYQGNAKIGGGSTYEFYEIGDLTFYEETGQTNEEILSGEIEEEKASVLKHQYLILLAEKRVAACEIELFKEKHPEMSEEEKVEFERLSQEYEAKKSAAEEFKKEHPEAILLLKPTPPDSTPPNPAPNPGRYQPTDPSLEP
ncbi:MAG: hypothetical protein Q4E70_03465 [Candidatus Saccharibacteria bacterium]|nr:hypothetical protein [Candidatus Saccharibacteria bacterium]